MNNLPKKRRCTECKAEFQPVKKGLSVSKQCSPKCKKAHIEKFGKTAAKLKAELWPIFSLHQKLVHSSDGKTCNCYTCGALLEIGTINCQGGHCLPKSVYKNLYFDERAVRPQCVRCNKNHGGMSYDFMQNLRMELGEEAVDDMIRHGKDVVKRDAKHYSDLIEHYKSEVKKLKGIKCKDM